MSVSRPKLSTQTFISRYKSALQSTKQYAPQHRAKFQSELIVLPLQTGEICLDILKTAWSPAWTLQSVCQAIIALMSDSAPDSPLNCDAGNLLRANDIRGYNSLASLYTVEFAKSAKP